jgi:hypothetical protein
MCSIYVSILFGNIECRQRIKDRDCGQCITRSPATSTTRWEQKRARCSSTIGAIDRRVVQMLEMALLRRFPRSHNLEMHPVMSHLHKWSTFTILCVRLTYTWSWLTFCLVANNCSCSSRKDFWKVRVCFQDSDLKQTSISTVQTWDPGYCQLFRLEVHTVHCFL